MAGTTTVQGVAMDAGRNTRGGNKNSFYGKGLKKGSRRRNAVGRLLYPYVKSDQVGTAMETFVDTNYDNLINANNTRQGGPRSEMKHTDAAGRLKSDWKNVYNRTINDTVKSIMSKKKSGGVKNAKARANQIYVVNFGSDPKRR